MGLTFLSAFMRRLAPFGAVIRLTWLIVLELIRLRPTSARQVVDGGRSTQRERCWGIRAAEKQKENLWRSITINMSLLRSSTVAAGSPGKKAVRASTDRGVKGLRKLEPSELPSIGVRDTVRRGAR